MIAFTSESNRLYLKREIMRRYHGNIGDDVLIEQMTQNGYYYTMSKDTEETYGPVSMEDIRRYVHWMNERTIHRIGQLYHAQRLVTSEWLGYAHQADITNWEQPENQNDTEQEVEIFRN